MGLVLWLLGFPGCSALLCSTTSEFSHSCIGRSDWIGGGLLVFLICFRGFLILLLAVSVFCFLYCFLVDDSKCIHTSGVRRGCGGMRWMARGGDDGIRFLKIVYIPM